MVLLPEPATPKIIFVSPRRRSKETPSSTGASSNAMETSSKIIALWTVSCDRSSSSGMVASRGGMAGSAQTDKELGKDGIDEQNEHRRHDHGLRGGTTYALRTALGVHAVETTDGGDDKTKYQR